MILRRILAPIVWLRRAMESAESHASEQPMKLVVGLGNPGRKYLGTRHNVGYEVVDRLAEKFGPARFRRQFEGRSASVAIAGERVLLLLPETYMNLSGRSVQPALAFHKLSTTQLLVICDDLNLTVGNIRVRARGSDGGQKGLRNIAEQLGTTEYPRLRVGIGPLPAGRDASDFVLGRFLSEERTQVNAALEQAVDAVVVWCRSGIEECMNQFN